MNNKSDLISEDLNLTKVHIDLPNHWWFKGESLWAKSLGNDLYEIENVPFCAYGLNCGDVVHATADAPDLKPEIRSVVRRSGNQTLRVSFNVEKEEQQPYLQGIEAKGAWIERAKPKFICISIPPDVSYEGVREYLNEQEAAGVLEYETCEARIPGSFDDGLKKANEV
jgi:Domain of unknown function (DUF4265)